MLLSDCNAESSIGEIHSVSRKMERESRVQVGVASGHSVNAAPRCSMNSSLVSQKTNEGKRNRIFIGLGYKGAIFMQIPLLPSLKQAHSSANRASQ